MNMNETKNCPYCGEEILAGARKCKHCGEWLEEEAKPKPVSVVMNDGFDVHFKTVNPKWWQKLLQMYWFNPKSWLLDELEITNNVITVSVKNGQTLSCPLDQLKVRLQEDKYGRKESYLSCGEEKIHFKEVPFMLSDNEWESLFEKLLSLDDVGETKLNKVNLLLKKAIEAGEDVME